MHSSSILLHLQKLTRTETGLGDVGTMVAITSSGLCVLESLYSHPTQFQIERIPLESSETCHGRYGGKNYNARIAKC